MGKPDAYTFDNFTGLDLRSGVETAPPESAIAARNAYLTPGRDYLSRPPLRKVADLDITSKGLYLAGDKLRSAVRWNQWQMPLSIPDLIVYDQLRGGLMSDTANTFDSVASTTTWQGRPYLCVSMGVGDANPRYEHHFAGAEDASSMVTLTNGSTNVPGLPAPRGDAYLVRFAGVGPEYMIAHRVIAADTLETAWAGTTTANVPAVIWDTADTHINLPFVPGPPVTTAAEKVWATDAETNNVWFSSTEFGPTNWTALDDAGFIPTSTHIDGDQPILGLGTYRGQVIVLALRALQIWNVDPDPAKHSIAGNVGGSGCDFPRTVTNTGGDLLLFATGQFRTLSAIITTGQPKDTDVGANIATLTRSLLPGGTEMFAVWWPNLQLYLGFYGSTVYALTSSPQSNVQAWTTWTLPFTVSHAVYWRGKVWVRRADTPELWCFDPESQDYSDEAGAGVAFTGSVQWAWNTLDGTRRAKFLRQMVVPQEGNSTMSLRFDPRTPAFVEDFYEIHGSTTGQGRIAVQAIAEILSPAFSFTGYWRLGEITIYYERGNLL
jgi:hypothetical protein